MKKYKLAPQAEKDLLTIFLEGIEKWGYTQAEKYADEFHECFNLLAEFPEMGNTRKEFEETLQSFEKGSHTIFYRRVDNQSIEISTLIPQRMDLKNHW